MIYDLNSHIEHTIKSPFTCYDWKGVKSLWKKLGGTKSSFSTSIKRFL